MEFDDTYFRERRERRKTMGMVLGVFVVGLGVVLHGAADSNLVEMSAGIIGGSVGMGLVGFVRSSPDKE